MAKTPYDVYFIGTLRRLVEVIDMMYISSWTGTLREIKPKFLFNLGMG